jgi:hypothetical protein
MQRDGENRKNTKLVKEGDLCCRRNISCGSLQVWEWV